MKSAYHHIEIFEQHRKYLGFAWTSGQETKYYVFNVLPFGISTAGYVFTKVMRTVVKHFRNAGYRMIMFLDDGLAGSADVVEAQEMSNQIQKTLHELGFLIAEKKCKWEPGTRVTCLGLDWVFQRGVVHLDQKRISNLKRSIQELNRRYLARFELVPVKTLACIIGKIVSMHTVLGNLVQLRTREAFKCLNTRASWKAKIIMSKEAKHEMKFWKENVDRLNTTQINEVACVHASIFTDASGRGYGGYVLDHEYTEVMGLWTDTERFESSTWRELEAAYRIVSDVAHSLEGLNVRLYTDNKNVVKIIKSGSRKTALQRKALQIKDICEKTVRAWNRYGFQDTKISVLTN